MIKRRKKTQVLVKILLRQNINMLIKVAAMKTQFLRFRIIPVFVICFFIVLPEFTNARTWTGCTYKNLAVGNTWLDSPSNKKWYNSWFPEYFSFDESKLIWNGDAYSFHNEDEGKYTAFYEHPSGVLPARITIDTDNILRLKIQWVNQKDTNWIPFVCKSSPTQETAFSKTEPPSEINPGQKIIPIVNRTADLCQKSNKKIKEAQLLLKDLNEYKGKIDGLWGRDTSKALERSLKSTGEDPINVDCLTGAHISVLQNLIEDKLCSAANLQDCSFIKICERATVVFDGGRSWDNKNMVFVNHAKNLNLGCNVINQDMKLSDLGDTENKNASFEMCRSDDIEACADKQICEKATLVRDGVRSWHHKHIDFIRRAKELELDCKLTIDLVPMKQAEAIYFLTHLIDFVQTNPTEFDLKFAKEFDKVRAIVSGNWSTSLSDHFEKFRAFSKKYSNFHNLIEQKRIADEATNIIDINTQKEKMRSLLFQDLIVLMEWARSNVLDEKSVQISSLNYRYESQDIQNLKALRQMLSESENLLAAIGVTYETSDKTMRLIKGLYKPSSFYLFGNISGDASNLYKNLSGKITFERHKATFCASDKLDRFDYYLLQNKIFETFDRLNTIEEECSSKTDLFITRGNELNESKIANILYLNDVIQVLELTREQRAQEIKRFDSLKVKIEKGVTEGTIEGYGIVTVANASDKICAVNDNFMEGHIGELQDRSSLLRALGYSWSGFEKRLENAEEAFKQLQRQECGAVYSDALTMNRLRLASKLSRISIRFIPLWITKPAIELRQKEYQAAVVKVEASNIKAKQDAADRVLLNEKMQQNLMQVAAQQQKILREKKSFIEKKGKIIDAVQNGVDNFAESPGYFSQYLNSLFSGQTSRYSTFDGIVADVQVSTAEGWEIMEKTLEKIDYGSAQFSDRKVDAIIVDLEMSMRNSLVGRYLDYCRRIHVLKDKDFDIWRNIEVTECNEYYSIPNWKSDQMFVSEWIVEP